MSLKGGIENGSDGAGEGKARETSLSAVGISFALVSAICFSTLGIFASSLYGLGFSVPQTLAWRFTVASIFLWGALAARKVAHLSGPRRQEGFQTAGKAERPGERARAFRNLLLLALFGFSPQAGLYFLTVKLLAPGITSLLLYLYPAFVLLLSAIFLRKKASVGQILALSMSVIGCMITFFTPGNYPLIGLILAVLVALAYGGYLVVGEKVFAGFDSLFSTAVIMTVAGLVYWAWLVAARLPIKTPAGVQEWLLIAGIALIATALPITTLFAAMKRAGAANTSLISTIEPVATVLLSGIFLGERLTGNRIVGGLFIIAGVIALRLFSRKIA
ncbi:MAG: DMT family transporter [Spirochaetales bacterium]|jgi:drug/metabolite transporter (DMT)-like permease